MARNQLRGAGRRATRRLVTVPSTAGLPRPEPLALPGRGQTVVVDAGPRDAPAIVLLHSVACTGLLTWYPALERLAGRYRVVVFDQRWHGQGIRSRDFGLEDCRDDVLAVADALGIGRFTIAGYSMGGMVGQLVAHACPDRVDGLVLCSTASNFRRGLRQRVALDVFGRTMRRLREEARFADSPRRVSARERVDHRWALAEFRATSPGRSPSPWTPSGGSTRPRGCTGCGCRCRWWCTRGCNEGAFHSKFCYERPLHCTR